MDEDAKAAMQISFGCILLGMACVVAIIFAVAGAIK